jgi:hypothetical protein
MVNRSNELIGSVVNYLNDNLYDSNSSNRAGSYVFGPDKEMNFKRQLPKVQVKFFGDSEIAGKTMGYDYKRSKNTTIIPIFFTTVDYLDPTNNIKNEGFVMYMLEEIEQTIKNTTFDNFHLVNVGETGEIEFSSQHGIYVGGIPLVFQRRES